MASDQYDVRYRPPNARTSFRARIVRVEQEEDAIQTAHMEAHRRIEEPGAEVQLWHIGSEGEPPRLVKTYTYESLRECERRSEFYARRELTLYRIDREDDGGEHDIIFALDEEEANGEAQMWGNLLHTDDVTIEPIVLRLPASFDDVSAEDVLALVQHSFERFTDPPSAAGRQSSSEAESSPGGSK